MKKTKVLLFHGFMVHDRHDLRHFKEYLDDHPIDNAEFELVYLYDRHIYSSSSKKNMVKKNCKLVREYKKQGYEVIIIGYSFSCIIAAEVSKKMKLNGVVYLAPTIQLFKSRLFKLHLFNAMKTVKLRLKYGKKKANKILEKTQIKGIIPLSYHITSMLTFTKRSYKNNIPYLAIRGDHDTFCLKNDLEYVSRKSKASYKKSITKIGENYNHYFVYDKGMMEDFLYDEVKNFLEEISYEK